MKIFLTKKCSHTFFFKIKDSITPKSQPGKFIQRLTTQTAHPILNNESLFGPMSRGIRVFAYAWSAYAHFCVRARFTLFRAVMTRRLRARPHGRGRQEKYMDYDLCVIGGGINGVGIARDAAGAACLQNWQMHFAIRTNQTNFLQLLWDNIWQIWTT